MPELNERALILNVIGTTTTLTFARQTSAPSYTFESNVLNVSFIE